MNGNLVLQGLIEPGYYGTDYTGTEYNADYTSGRGILDDNFNGHMVDLIFEQNFERKGILACHLGLGENISTVGWPNCGEIDIMEHVGFEEDGVIHGSIHTEDYNHGINTQGLVQHLLTPQQIHFIYIH